MLPGSKGATHTWTNGLVIDLVLGTFGPMFPKPG